MSRAPRCPSKPDKVPSPAGRAIRELRMRSGYSRLALAKELGISVRNIENVEDGETQYPSDVLRRAAVFYKMSIDDLREGKLPPSPHTRRPDVIKEWFHDAYLTDHARIIRVLRASHDVIVERAEPINDPRTDVDGWIRNSNRWRLDTAGRQLVLREALRKAVSTESVLRQKYRVLSWLRTMNLPVVEPEYVVDRTEQFANTEGGTRYELYEYRRSGVAYSLATLEHRPRVVDWIATLLGLTQRLGDSAPELLASLQTRFSNDHQFFGRTGPSVPAIDALRVRLRSKPHDKLIERILDEAQQALEDHAKMDLPSMQAEQPLRLTHGDLTENNFLLCSDAAWLLDWDTVRVTNSGPFDLCFALARLAHPEREGEDPLPSELIPAARRMLNDVRQRTPPSLFPDEADIALGLEEVRREFTLRMFEYLTVSAEAPSHRVQRDYLARCSPGRAVALREVLTHRTRV
ncbi:MAG: phosphotransferase [Deltaproteobacteria bacterium]|nr:phosphotransferase [Deltaproteobacteria bacterium]